MRKGMRAYAAILSSSYSGIPLALSHDKYSASDSLARNSFEKECTSEALALWSRIAALPISVLILAGKKTNLLYPIEKFSEQLAIAAKISVAVIMADP
jgi:hypothetical protein